MKLASHVLCCSSHCQATPLVRSTEYLFFSACPCLSGTSTRLQRLHCRVLDGEVPTSGFFCPLVSRVNQLLPGLVGACRNVYSDFNTVCLLCLSCCLLLV